MFIVWLTEHSVWRHVAGKSDEIFTGDSVIGDVGSFQATLQTACLPLRHVRFTASEAILQRSQPNLLAERAEHKGFVAKQTWPPQIGLLRRLAQARVGRRISPQKLGTSLLRPINHMHAIHTGHLDLRWLRLEDYLVRFVTLSRRRATVPT
jgi:hypothetical protein